MVQRLGIRGWSYMLATRPRSRSASATGTGRLGGRGGSPEPDDLAAQMRFAEIRGLRGEDVATN